MKTDARAACAQAGYDGADQAPCAAAWYAGWKAQAGAIADGGPMSDADLSAASAQVNAVAGTDGTDTTITTVAFYLGADAARAHAA